jgi:hypothetical protein
MPITFKSDVIKEVYSGPVRIYTKPVDPPATQYDLVNNLNNWGYVQHMDNRVLSNNNKTLRFTVTGVDPIMQLGTSFAGASYKYFYAKIKSVAAYGFTNYSQIFFANGAHSFSEAQSINKPWLGDGREHVLKYNMHATNLDWNGSTISTVRFDPSIGNSTTNEGWNGKQIEIVWLALSNEDL